MPNTRREYLIGRRFICGHCGKKMNGQGRIIKKQAQNSSGRRW